MSSIVYIFMEIEQLQLWARWLELQRDRAIAVLELEQEEEAEGRRHRRRRQISGEVGRSSTCSFLVCSAEESVGGIGDSLLSSWVGSTISG